jgi:hypothetical protein
MPIFSRLIFRAVQWSARRGLGDGAEPLALEPAVVDADARGKFEKKQSALRAGLRGETYAYWYLRRLGYVFVAKNYMPRGAKGELDLIGYEGRRWRLWKCGRGRCAMVWQPSRNRASISRNRGCWCGRRIDFWRIGILEIARRGLTCWPSIMSRGAGRSCGCIRMPLARRPGTSGSIGLSGWG